MRRVVETMPIKPTISVCGKDVKIAGRLLRVASIDGEKFTFPDDPEVFLDALRQCGKRIDLFTFLERIPVTSPRYSYQMELDNLAVLRVSTFEHWWSHQIRSFARNRARQAEKRGVVLREVPFDDHLLRGICEIYNETPLRQGRPFPHYGMTLEQARAYAGTFLDRSVFIAAFFEGSMIGFVKLVTDETRTHACAIHILSMIRHRDKAPTNALIAQAVRSCVDRGISYLVYEQFSYGKKLNDRLSEFKANNGFQKVDVPRYYVALTSVGRTAVHLGLHHKVTDLLPESLMARLRAARTAWYERKLRGPQTSVSE
jgi:hypothetical protein